VKFRLIAITDRKSCKDSTLIDKITSICKEGVRAVQVREKDLPGAELLSLSKGLRTITLSFRSSLIINDRVDIAFLSRADAIHLPENGLPISILKQYRKKFLFGKSTHSVESVQHAEKDGFDYLMFGPVFRTFSKIKYGKPMGLKRLKEVCESVSIPVFAVGGITPERAKKCIDNGAYGDIMLASCHLARAG
jgi:thiamine-phosphate pyrophosphorylase